MAVWCDSPSWCTAVGFALDNSSNAFTVAERWNGTAWTLERTPNGGRDGSFDAVSCVSPRACTAVGNSEQGALAERWNGRRWTVQNASLTARPAGILYGVSCPSTTKCTAGGSYVNGAGAERTLAERWNRG
jgi:hypothetical protein